MKRFMRMPSPALVVALVALFVAMGGSAYAAIVITGKNIRAGTVEGSDIKNKALHGRDVKADSLGGIPIKEERLVASKIGTVRDAAGVGGAEARRIAAFTLDNGQSREVLSAGPLRLTANCRSGESGTQVAEIIASTTANDSAVDGAQKDADLDVGQSAQLVAAGAPAGTPAFDQEGSGTAIAADGTEIVGQELYAGASVLGQPNKCRFGGLVFVG